MSFILPAKAPGDTVNYAVSFATFAGGATISSYTLAVAAQPNGTATILAQSRTGYVINMQLTGGGVPGQTLITYLPTVFDLSVTFSDGRVVSSTLLLPILPPALLRQPRTSTKRQIVDMAYEECALAGYEFDVTPEELQSALRRLDALMAEWEGQGIRLAYNAPPSIGTGSLDDWSGIPDAAVNAAVLYLALRIAPRMNKALGGPSQRALGSAMVAVRALTAVIPERQLALDTPYGAGNRYWSLQWPLSIPGVVQVDYVA